MTPPIDPGSVADDLTKFLMSDALFDVWKKCDMPMTMVTFGTAIYPFVTQHAREENYKLLSRCYVDQGEIYVRLPNGFIEQYHYIAELKAKGNNSDKP